MQGVAQWDKYLAGQVELPAIGLEYLRRGQSTVTSEKACKVIPPISTVVVESVRVLQKGS